MRREALPSPTRDFYRDAPGSGPARMSHLSKITFGFAFKPVLTTTFIV
jgi:hypothetical protein